MGKFYEGLYEALSLFVRHVAWLNTTPERAKHDKSEAPRLTRLETMRREFKDDDYHPEMPPLDGAAFLLSYLFELGPTQAAGMGAAPISHQEIAAWQELTGIVLQPWQARFLRRLSGEYVAESHKAEKRECPAPWRAADAKPVVTDTQAALRALAAL